MWVTTDNIFISDSDPDSGGFMYVHRPCPNCLGSGINCLSCTGTGTLPPKLEKVYPVYEWAAFNGLKLPFEESVEQTCLKQLLAPRLAASGHDKSGFFSSLNASLNKSNFPTRLQYRYLLPVTEKEKSVVNHPIRPFKAKPGITLSLVLSVKNIEVLTRKYSSERFSSLLLETTDHRHFIAYEPYPPRHSTGDVISCVVLTVKRLWIHNMSILLVKILSSPAANQNCVTTNENK